MKVSFELTGETPLLMHPDDIEAADEIKAWQKAPENKNFSVAGDDRSPAWGWQTNLYSDGIMVVMPAQNIMVCLRQAGSQMILKRQKTFKEISQSGLVIHDEYCRFFTGDTQVDLASIASLHDLPFSEQAEAVKELGFRLFVKRAKIGQSKHVRVRPRFDTWSVKGTIAITAKEITFEHLQQMFELAGRVGLCDWRPGCKTPGPYGMFSAKLKKA